MAPKRDAVDFVFCLAASPQFLKPVVKLAACEAHDIRNAGQVLLVDVHDEGVPFLEVPCMPCAGTRYVDPGHGEPLLWWWLHWGASCGDVCSLNVRLIRVRIRSPCIAVHRDCLDMPQLS